MPRIIESRTFEVFGPGDDPAGIDPAGRICEMAKGGEPLYSAGLSEFCTWDDVLCCGPSRRHLAAMAWALGAMHRG